MNEFNNICNRIIQELADKGESQACSLYDIPFKRILSEYKNVLTSWDDAYEYLTIKVNVKEDKEVKEFNNWGLIN